MRNYLWAAPCSLVGLTLALPTLLTGATAQKIDGVLEVALPEHGLAANLLYKRLPFIAITFGHVVIGINACQLARLRAHEHAHVRQYEHWGLLFFLAYPASSVMQWLKGKHPYWHNHFEIAARQAADDIACKTTHIP